MQQHLGLRCGGEAEGKKDTHSGSLNSDSFSKLVCCVEPIQFLRISCDSLWREFIFSERSCLRFGANRDTWLDRALREVPVLQ